MFCTFMLSMRHYTVSQKIRATFNLGINPWNTGRF